MRSLLAESLAGIAWNDAARRQPLRVATLKKLVAAGYSASLARELVAALPEDLPAGEAVRWLAGALAGRLVCAPDEAIVDSGGVYALVGPTGVGKTTTTAKLAARAAMKFGARRVALVSTDAYRIGAHEQLRAFGRILGVPVHAVQDPAGLAALAAGFADKHVVLIDTVGMGQRDDRVAEQRELLAAGGARRVLLLNASGQGETLEDVVAAYGGESLVGCIVTKIDEAVRLAPVLDTLMRHRLPLHFVANGQRVPEDLHAPNTAYLLHRSLKDIPGSPYRLLPEEEGAVLGRLQLALGAANAAR
jgi:flagellar biosynthesis protein FlhF